MSKVYLAMARTDYEGSDVICAFSFEIDAEAFVVKCREYQDMKPECPSTVEDTPENDAAFEKHWKKYERWKKKHPAGEHGPSADYFEVEPVELVTAQEGRHD